jgi:hypothetical protein
MPTTTAADEFRVFLFFSLRVSRLCNGTAGQIHWSFLLAGCQRSFGAIGHELREEGWTVPAIQTLYKKSGYVVGKETLRGWTAAAGRGNPIISPNKQAGAQKKVDDEQRQVAAGWVLEGKKKLTADAILGL